MTRDISKFQRWGEDPGWRAIIGFITAPNVGLSIWEFMKIAPAGFLSTQQHTYVATKEGKPKKFDFSVEGIQEAFQQIELCAQVLSRKMLMTMFCSRHSSPSRSVARAVRSCGG